jgi:hypothetical protein
VEKQYEVYCLKDRLFYDVLDGQKSAACAIVDDRSSRAGSECGTANGSSTARQLRTLPRRAGKSILPLARRTPLTCSYASATTGPRSVSFKTTAV